LFCELSGGPTDALSDEQLAAMVAHLEEQIAAKLSGENAKVINAQAEPSAKPTVNGWIGPPSKGAPGARKVNPKSTPRGLEYAREYSRKRREAAKAAQLGQAQAPAISDCTENNPSLPSSGEEQLE
jgi:hypothetical protein